MLTISSMNGPAVKILHPHAEFMRLGSQIYSDGTQRYFVYVIVAFDESL